MLAYFEQKDVPAKNHPTVKKLFEICNEFVCSAKLQNDLISYLNECRRRVDHMDKFVEFLDALLPVVRSTPFLGFLTNPMVLYLLRELAQADGKAHYMLFLSLAYPGKVVIRGVSNEHDDKNGGFLPMVEEVDPVRGQPTERMYNTMVHLQPMRRAKTSLSIYCHPLGDFSNVYRFPCGNCGPVSMTAQRYHQQCLFNTNRDTKTNGVVCEYQDWIPCPVCKKSKLVINTGTT